MLGLGFGFAVRARLGSACSPSSSMPSRKKVITMQEGMVIRWFHEGSTLQMASGSSASHRPT